MTLYFGSFYKRSVLDPVWIYCLAFTDFDNKRQKASAAQVGLIRRQTKF
jgi:hypothetical protein